MADKTLEEWLFKQQFHPVPFVRYSERPDIVAAHLLEGHIAIIVDTSPSVILLPITIFHLLTRGRVSSISYNWYDHATFRYVAFF